MRTIDLDSWNRREHFRFFLDYDNPFFNVCANVDVTRLHGASAAPTRTSFFLSSLYAASRAANDTEAFRYRIRGDRVVVHDVVHPGSTVLRADETFTFAYFEYHPDFDVFQERAAEELLSCKEATEPLDPRDIEDDRIHFSVLPWVSFTSFSHARRWGTRDSVPKIVFGKHFERFDRRVLPVSVEVHHSLVDGLHVGRWFERFQALLDDDALLG